MANVQHISSFEAKERRLNGSDVYKYSHLIYHDELNRDAAVVQLCRESLKAFSDTILVRNRHAIASERLALNRWSNEERADAAASWPASPYIDACAQWVNFENFKIATAFELLLKAILLQKDYIAHEVAPVQPYLELSKLQKKSPIDKNELFKIDGYRFDGKINYLPGLGGNSLKFSVLVCKDAYRSIYNIDRAKLDVMNEFRMLRNQIHLPGDIIETPTLQSMNSPMESFILNIINEEIVERANTLTLKHSLNWSILFPLA